MKFTGNYRRGNLASDADFAGNLADIFPAVLVLTAFYSSVPAGFRMPDLLNRSTALVVRTHDLDRRLRFLFGKKLIPRFELCS